MKWQKRCRRLAAFEMGYVDLFGLADALATTADTPDDVRGLARLLREAADAMVLSSYGTAQFETTGGFEAGKHGLSIVFPASGPGVSRDPVQRWANYTWCPDGATFGDGVVETWFELLDA